MYSTHWWFWFVCLGRKCTKRVDQISGSPDHERSRILKDGIQKLVRRRELGEAVVPQRPEVDLPKPSTGASYESKVNT